MNTASRLQQVSDELIDSISLSKKSDNWSKDSMDFVPLSHPRSPPRSNSTWFDRNYTGPAKKGWRPTVPRVNASTIGRSCSLSSHNALIIVRNQEEIAARRQQVRNQNKP
jgi:hypothetical protein